MRLQVCIVTPDCIFQNEEADELILPTNTGRIGVLRGHAPLITVLDIGLITLRRSSTWTALALIGGFALVDSNTITILVNEAISTSSIKPKEAEQELEQATRCLNEAASKKEKVEITFSFKRARARYQLTQWKQN